MRTLRRLLFAGLVLTFAGCSNIDFPTDDELTTLTQEIVNGQQPDSPIYLSTVGLANDATSGLWCSGTLVANSTSIGSGGAGILTAAHCVEGESAGSLYVYVGCGTLAETDGVQNGCPVPGWYSVSEVEAHWGYNNWGLNDIAMIRLTEPIPRCDDPGINPSTDTCANAAGLVPADFFQPGHIGELALNFAGFGYNPADPSPQDVKLQVGDFTGCNRDDPYCITVDSYGCRDYGCKRKESDSNQQVSYVQAPPPQYGIGPCSGDSGGPAYVLPSDVIGAPTGPGSPEAYVAGVTTFGDPYCDIWGTSTRVDYFRTFIDDFIGEPTCSTADDCDDGNVCTDDVCGASGCEYNNNADPCDDDDLCTSGDACSAGSCQGVPRDCNDDNVCTSDGCNPADGLCDNSDIDCDDGNVCTDENGCDAVTGCLYDDNTLPCDNGDSCPGDECSGGNCQAAACLCLGHRESCQQNSDCCSNRCHKNGRCIGD